MMSTLWITSERGKHEIALTLSIYPEDRSVQIFYYSNVVNTKPAGLLVPFRDISETK